MTDQDVAIKIGNTIPARPATGPAPKGCDQLVEYATEHGWSRAGTFEAEGWEIVKRKAPPEEEGRKYSMQETKVPVQLYTVLLVKGRIGLVLIYHDGKWECAISDKPMRKYNTRSVRKFMRGEE